MSRGVFPLMGLRGYPVTIPEIPKGIYQITRWFRDMSRSTHKPSGWRSRSGRGGPTSPEALAGHEKNWVQTMKGEGYNAALRLYGPLEPWFNQTWRPGDIAPVK